MRWLLTFPGHIGCDDLFSDGRKLQKSYRLALRPVGVRRTKF
nr:MAG TPA: hypothetical protein [Caudoviricetes sp.]